MTDEELEKVRRSLIDFDVLTAKDPRGDEFDYLPWADKGFENVRDLLSHIDDLKAKHKEDCWEMIRDALRHILIDASPISERGDFLSAFRSLFDEAYAERFKADKPDGGE